MTFIQYKRLAAKRAAETATLNHAADNLVRAVMEYYSINNRSAAMELAAREGWINVKHFRLCVGVK